MIKILEHSSGRRLFQVLAATGIVTLSAVGLTHVADAASPVTVTNDQLTVTGTTGDDQIVLQLADPNTVGVDFGADGTLDFTANRSQFSTILVKGLAGNDTITASNSGGVFTDTEATTLDGGSGNDTLIGGAGAESLQGGPGNDFIDGNIGADTIDGGGGRDTIQWDPGDGSDTVIGGTGADQMQFNGSNASEAMDVAAVGDHVRFTRNVAAITMDLVGVETLNVRLLGGTDTLHVNDLTGTGMKAVNADLAPVGGGDDGALDDVSVPPESPVDLATSTADVHGTKVHVLNGSPGDTLHLLGTPAAEGATILGTSGADSIGAAADGTDVVVFGATPGVGVRVTAVERLEVDLGAGNDTFTGQNGIGSRTFLVVDGGTGNDTIRGGDGGDILMGGAGNDFIDGNIGADLILGGTGNDVIQWDPGDGSDTVQGDAGADRLDFNGSNAGELMDVSANGGRVRLFRNIAAITMDFDDIETLNIRAVGSSDGITVNDLTGTDLKAVNVDLSATGGGDDGAADDVVLNGTPGDDRFTITNRGSTVLAKRAGFTLGITGANPANDRLTVNGLAGTDLVSATPGTSALILLNLVS